MCWVGLILGSGVLLCVGVGNYVLGRIIELEWMLLLVLLWCQSDAS